MSVLQPDSKRMLGIMLRELEQTVAPDLTSPHAQTVAHLIGQGLRNLLTREDTVPGLIDDWNRTAEGLIDNAGLALPLSNPVDRVAHNAALGARLESIVKDRLEKYPRAALDDVSKKALEAECNYFLRHAEAVAKVEIPQRSAQRRDQLAITPERLTNYFARKLTQFKSCRVTAVNPVVSGFSKETVLVDLEVDGTAMPVVIRRNIQYGAVDSDVVQEYPLIVALRGHGLPVPEAVLVETDVSEFGEAFTVTKRAPGVAATNSMSGLAAGPEMVNAARELAAFLARLHQINPDELNLPRAFHDPALTTRDCLTREIDICERYYRNHRLQPSPTIAAALLWLRANLPLVDGPPRMLHGDASLANLMMDGERMSVMLDWELAHTGDPNEDVIYTRKWIDQIMPWQDFLAHYYRHGGPQYHPERENFYAVLCDLRVAMLAVRNMDMVKKGDQPEATHMYSAQHYYGYFIGIVAKHLLDV